MSETEGKLPGISKETGEEMKPYDYQKEVLRSDDKVKVLRWGRRTGKDTVIQILQQNYSNPYVISFESKLSTDSFDPEEYDLIVFNEFSLIPNANELFLKALAWQPKGDYDILVVGTPVKTLQGGEDFFNSICKIAPEIGFYSQMSNDDMTDLQHLYSDAGYLTQVLAR